jgi:hypothetical protein
MNEQDVRGLLRMMNQAYARAQSIDGQAREGENCAHEVILASQHAAAAIYLAVEKVEHLLVKVVEA